MLDKEEIRWLKNTCNELNNLLQRIYGYTFLSVERTTAIPEVQEALGLLVDSVERASHVTQSMLGYVAECEEYINPRQPHPPINPYGSRLQQESSPGDADKGCRKALPDVRPAHFELSGAEVAAKAAAMAAAAKLSSERAGTPGTLEPAPKNSTEPPVKQPPLGLGGQVGNENTDVKAGRSGVHEGKAAGKVSGLDFTGIPIENADGEKELILVVDDEAEVARLIQTMLTEAGYRVIAVQDGFRAIEIYKKIGAAIDLVLLDFAMPVMDGEDVFDELRLINPNVAVILSSGFPQQAKLSNLLARGLRGFMPKPYTRDKLVSQVRQALSLGVKSS